MSARKRARTGAQIADGLRRLARIIETDGTPGRYIPEQALGISYNVTDPVGVIEFADRHGLKVTHPTEGSETSWAELPLGEGVDKPERGYSAAYSGAVYLRAVYVAPQDETDRADAARRVL